MSVRVSSIIMRHSMTNISKVHITVQHGPWKDVEGNSKHLTVVHCTSYSKKMGCIRRTTQQ